MSEERKQGIAPAYAVAEMRRINEPHAVNEPVDGLPSYDWDNPAPGTRLWRYRNHPETLSREGLFRLVEDFEARLAAPAEAALSVDGRLREAVEQWVELYQAHTRGGDLGPIFERHVREASDRLRVALSDRPVR